LSAADTEPRIVFVTGTDTGVGKTTVTAALAVFLRQRGIDLAVMKPVETGVDDPAALGPDARLLRWASGCEEPDDLIAPYRFSAPLAPDQAAKSAGRRIDLGLLAGSANRLAERHRLLLIEGAGGLMVPLAGGLLIADLVARLGARLLVVTRPDLGTLNHTLLTVFAARTMQLPLAGMILNRMPASPDQAQQNAPHALASLASCDLLSVLPEVEGKAEERAEALAREISSQSTLTWLLMGLGLGEVLRAEA